MKNRYRLAELKRQGLIRHLGLSNVSPQQLAEAERITEIVCVQNFYNVAHRTDDGFTDDLAKPGKAYVPFFPPGGFTPLQSSALDTATASLRATPMQVALATNQLPNCRPSSRNDVRPTSAVQRLYVSREHGSKPVSC